MEESSLRANGGKKIYEKLSLGEKSDLRRLSRVFLSRLVEEELYFDFGAALHDFRNRPQQPTFFAKAFGDGLAEEEISRVEFFFQVNRKIARDLILVALREECTFQKNAS